MDLSQQADLLDLSQQAVSTKTFLLVAPKVYISFAISVIRLNICFKCITCMYMGISLVLVGSQEGVPVSAGMISYNEMDDDDDIKLTKKGKFFDI